MRENRKYRHDHPTCYIQCEIAMQEQAIEAELKDGTPIQVFLDYDCDKQCLEQEFDRLTARSRHQRFFSPINKLSDAQLSYLINVDGIDHVLIVAAEAQGDQRRGIGLARYVRLKDEPNVAEFAITVVDAFQNRGLGSILMDALMTHAQVNSIHVLRGYVLASNRSMIRLLEGLGGQRKEEDGELCFDLNLAKRAAISSSLFSVLLVLDQK
ncbi:MAG: GNAT family N-acetyltransferase [Candidatus Thiodiazotropha sp. (ex Dulcina madagascariensis)]|nr:GNAT family N-acetyltransferase [Candidatus Thiodiazotropha sp. (ex Dulcina madagascariensis)]MCU7928278.1 GNAT family N-acetyltransferase [Candidatus Thiodiazotropha sp. (ex Dulcina madagascariensis)]